MDAPSSTIARVWIWHHGGGVFGVPLVNYLGWLLTGWLVFAGFAFYLRGRAVQGEPPSRQLRLIAILFYVSAGLTHLVPWALGQDGEVRDAAGEIWRVHDLRETTVAILIFTMVFSALLAALRLYDEKR
jgi:putative membrane protein